MTKRCELDEVPYKGIEVGEKVVFLSTSYGYTGLRTGFYRGMRGKNPVVEQYTTTTPYLLYALGTYKKVYSNRVHLKTGRIWSVKTITEMIEGTPGPDDFIDYSGPVELAL